MRVAVLMGGTSPEREVSLESGKAVCKALEENGHEISPVDFDRLAIEELVRIDPEVVFIALHGCPGEDGSVQGMLEVLGLPYTGSGILGSSLAIDKAMTKRILKTAALPVPEGIVIGPDFNVSAASASMSTMGANFPVVVKPSRGGSTIGISVAKTIEEMQTSIEEALKYDTHVLVEEFIDGPEITVSILDDLVLPSIQITSESGFYDYEAKYTKGMSHHIVPPDIDRDGVDMAEEMVLNGYHLLSLSGMARAEVMFNADGRPHILEYNTIPGFTPLSLLPDAAKHAGIEFPQLCEKLIEVAIRDRGGRRLR
jgi:D-alanine-D-alanine ligase